MFSGVLTKILLGALGLSLAWGGFNYVKWTYWDKPGFEQEIKDLKEAKLEWEVKARAQETVVKILDKQNNIIVRLGRDDQEGFRTEAAGDSPRMRQLLIERGLLKAAGDSSKSGPGGGAAHKPNAPPSKGAVN